VTVVNDCARDTEVVVAKYVRLLAG